ncbi:hypothetical protein [Myroides marinus]|uniref:hypothetical protein n=1 Tax=Myroides marinus TaxID=703342 RepID=UPI002577D49F|nr:hypothetical protein [Myroides marinus]MDM1532774.1 hypothetical protein [Myroides marinus]MDM1539796.1 hypothetical protein [Myroides marinus]
MKNCLLMVLLMVSTVVMAQKVSVKKEKILYGKDPIGTLVEKNKKITVSTLENEVLFTVEVNALMLDLKKYIQYFKVTTPKSAKDVYIETPYRGSIQSRSKLILKEFSSVSYPVFTEEGIDSEVVKKIMDTDDEKLSAIVKKITDAENGFKEKLKSFNSLGISINQEGEYGTIELGEFSTKGKVERREENDRLVYELFDEYDKQLAIWNEEGDSNLEFANGKKIYVPASIASPFLGVSTDDLVELMIVLTRK